MVPYVLNQTAVGFADVGRPTLNEYPWCSTTQHARSTGLNRKAFCPIELVWFALTIRYFLVDS